MDSIVKNSADFVKDLYEKKLPAGVVYHNFNHTNEVVEAAEELGKNSGLSDDQLEILLLAAWFHDTGITETYENHEVKSVEIAGNFLSRNNYPAEKRALVEKTILATRVPQNPGNLLEEVIGDADLLHIGRKGFNSRSQLLRSEWEQVCGKRINELEWLKENIEFISGNRFHTKYAREKFEEQRLKNLEKLKKKFREELMKKDSVVNLDVDENMKKILFEERTKQPGTDRGIETMFRNTMRTHVEFSGLADNKANIMISVNTLLLTAIIAILARKLDANPHLIIPTLFITLTSLATLIFATIVTRPKITSGIFTKEDIERKQANLLFFGNFYRMDLKNFEWGMNKMISDREYLYGSMIKDFYYLGQVLGQKYRYLRVCYNIFMYGLIISILAFTVAIMLYPEGTKIGPLIE